MARKFGKKNIIKIDPLTYNHGLMGESGIGKSTLAKEYCEELVGEDGYLHYDIGREDGAEAIDGIVTTKIDSWEDMIEIKKDILENRLTDYKDLRVIIYDTYDELIPLAEKEVVRMHNAAQRLLPNDKQKMATSVNGAFGGFGKGQEKVIDIIQDYMWDLKKVGIYMFIILHTKKRTINDPVADTSFDILSSKTQQNYFIALKTKLHFLGVVYVDRTIKQVEDGKDFSGNKKFKGVVSSEKRTIAFRDDNYSLDSKSRFADIAGKIPLDMQAYKTTIQDAINAERNKSGKAKPIEEAKKDQEKVEEQKIEQDIKRREDAKREKEERATMISKFKSLMQSLDHSGQKEAMSKVSEHGLSLAELSTTDVEKLSSLLKDVEGIGKE